MATLSRFGLDAWALLPPWSAIASLGLLLGIAAIGYRALIFFGLPSRLGLHSFWQVLAISPALGTALVCAFIYPWILFGHVAYLILFNLALLLLVLGATLGIVIGIQAAKLLKDRGHTTQTLSSSRFTILLVALLLLAYFFLALAPPSDADSLDYHLGIPLALLNSGEWVFSPSWFHSRLAGMGEMLNALGLAIGAEQFSSLIQFSGVLVVAVLLFPKTHKLSSHYIYSLLFLITPVLIWLSSAAKPLMLPIALTTLAVAILLGSKLTSKNTNADMALKPALTARAFTCICLVLLCASQMKFNFLLSGGIIGLLAFFWMVRAQKTVQASAIALSMILLILLPPLIWKSSHYGGTSLAILLSPFAGNWPGYEQFDFVLRHYRDSVMPFPLSLVFTTSPGQITTTLGITVLIWIGCVFWLFRQKNLQLSLILILGATGLMVAIGTWLGQIGSRFYLEPLIWVFLIMAQEEIVPNFLTRRFTLGLIYLQTLVILGIAGFGIYTLLPGAWSVDARTKLLEKNAANYSEMRWLDEVVPASAIVATEARSKALMPRPFLSMDWTMYVNPASQAALPYLLEMKMNKVTHLLLLQDPTKSVWKGCLSDQNADPLKPFKAQAAVRNPFNRGAEYWVWIASINSEKLPNCLGLF